MKRRWLLIYNFLLLATVEAQELEPRIYANLPKDMNAIGINYAFTKGNVIADPALPIKDFQMTTHTVGVGYLRTFSLANKFARVQFFFPFVYMEGDMKVMECDTSGTRTGFADARVRLGVNLIGAPALEKKDFVKYQQKTILAFSIVTSIPSGQYFSEKLVNIGSHRWGFKPELAISKRFDNLYAEVYMGTWFYTKNPRFGIIRELKQDPVYNLQTHVTYYFKNKIWLAVSGNWFKGGKKYIDGELHGDELDNVRLGGTLNVPVSPQHSFKLLANFGVTTKFDYKYNFWGLGYQYLL